MTNTVKNIFGVAAAIIVLLGLNMATDNFSPGSSSPNIALPDYNTTTTSAEERPVFSLKDLNDEIVDIAEKTNPAVVTITTEKTEQVQTFNPFAPFFGNQSPREEREFVRRGLGSGVLVSEEGYILTNNHVIEGVDEINIRLYSGDEVSAELIGTDPETDIAVLKVDVKNLPTIKLGNSEDLKVGSFVLAIGSPLSDELAHTVSFGIVSAKGRTLGLTHFGSYIQTDAAINPGNSGGALIDMNGELVGINTAIASRSGGNEGIGFAIPIDMAKRIMEDLLDDGSVSRGYLGMYLGGEVDRTMARALGLDEAGGIIVGQVESGGPADKAGLKEEDIILSLDGKNINSWDVFRNKIASLKPGDEIKLGILRDKKRMDIEITLGERESDSVASNNTNDRGSLNEQLGFTVMELTTSIKQQLNLNSSVEGVVVRDISQGSNAYERGLRQYDVISKVKDQKISSVSEFNSAMSSVLKANDEVVLLTVYRNGIQQYIAFEV